MNKSFLFSLSLALCVFSAQAQTAPDPLCHLVTLNAETQEPLSPKIRERAFSALGGLPADMDSFLAVNKLGELVEMLQLDSGTIPGIELASELDSFAVGITPRTAQDLQRLQPLFQVFSGALNEITEEWGQQATAEAARAIVAVQRAQDEADGARLVQATKDFHLAPIYMTLSAAPGGQMLLKQLSVLPLMLPMSTDAPIEMTVRSGWRGFCVRGDKLDLSILGLAPEQEQQLQVNLQKVRVYVLARMHGNKLTLVICSNPDEIKLPGRVADSFLASSRMADFDACLKRNVRAVGYSSPAVVKLREEADLFAYQNVAVFMQQVFARLGRENPTCAAAADAVKALLDMVTSVLPSQHGAERFMVWKDDALCLHLMSESEAIQFAPGALRFFGLSHAPETAVYAETTPLVAGLSVDVPAVLNCVETVQKGYLATILPEHAAKTRADLQMLQKHRPAWDALAGAVQKVCPSIKGSSAFLVRENSSLASESAVIYARADVTSTEQAREIGGLLQTGLTALYDAETIQPKLTVKDSSLALDYAGGDFSFDAPAGNSVGAAGAVMVVQVPVLARVMARDAARSKEADAIEAAETMLEFAQYVQRMEAATTSGGGRCSFLLRVYQPSSH